MPTLVDSPTRIPVPANKLIDEYIGRVNSRHETVSIAHMRSPAGWSERGQQPDFDEFTIVLRGALRVESLDGVLDVKAGQAVIARRGEWVRYSTPDRKVLNTLRFVFRRLIRGQLIETFDRSLT